MLLKIKDLSLFFLILLTLPPGGSIIFLGSDKMTNKKTIRTPEEKKYLAKRLKIIEGQVRGVNAMIESDRYCKDVLIQISAINKSLKSLANIIFENHISNCITKAMQEDPKSATGELMDLIRSMQ